MDEDMASPFTPHLEALAGHLNNFQVLRLPAKLVSRKAGHETPSLTPLPHSDAQPALKI